ncbi:MAG: acyl-CoA thioesterase [Burkholderiales bacterium]|nr:acyl-CoA thioesterase [Burkholderiales bacterium]
MSASEAGTVQNPSPLSPALAEAPLFVQRRRIRFSDCDPAGMVFFPQYFVMLNAVVEDWFTQALGIDYAHYLGERRMGLPTVALQAEFRAPCRMGDEVELTLAVERLGSRSITLRVDVRHQGAVCVQIRQSIVTTALAHDKAVPVPDDVAQAIQQWRHREKLQK